MSTNEVTATTIFLRGVLGGVANATTMLFSNPLDVLKIRFQLSNEGLQTALRNESTWNKAKTIARAEGFYGLYKGLSISMLRELTFSSGKSVSFFGVVILHVVSIFLF